MKKLFVLLDSYRKLSPELRDRLEVTLKCDEIKKGEFIFMEGDVCNRIFFIEKGLVRIFTRGEKREVTLWVQWENHIFIVVDSFFQQTRSEHFVQALEDMIVWSISYEQLQDILFRFPEFALHEREIKSEYYSIFHKRKSLLEQMTPEQKCKWFFETHAEIAPRLTANVIYTYLDLAKNTYYKALDKLAGNKNRATTK